MKNNEIFLNYYVVALVDVLGQTDKTLKLNFLPKNEEEFKVFSNLVKDTIQSVKNFRKTNKEIIDFFCRPFTFNETDLSEEERKHFLALEKPSIETQYISDSILFKIRLYQINPISILVSIHRLICSLSSIMLEHLAGCIPMRGAIEFGLCSELGENDLYGAAVTKAHILEKKCAVYPRILIGQNILEYINTFPLLKASLNEQKYINYYLKAVRDHIIVDPNDNLPIVNYLFKNPSDHFRGQEEIYKAVIRRACMFISNEIDKFRKSEETDKLIKYEKLQKFFKSQNYWLIN